MDSIHSIKSFSDDHGDLFINENNNANDVDSFPVHISQSSLWSSDSDLSLTINQELNKITESISNSDELPAFEIRLISPLSRSPSPIETTVETQNTCNTTTEENNNLELSRSSNSDFIALQDINSLINLPNDECRADIKRVKSLETIFEGVFLNTPPKKSNSQDICSNMLEKLAFNQPLLGKENMAAHCQERIPKPLLKPPAIRQKKIEFSELSSF